MGVMWLLCIQRKKKSTMRKPVSQMSEQEYAKHMRSLDRRIFFWGAMEALHPLPLVLLVLIVWVLCSFIWGLK
jgi:hypothetical protein